MARGSVTFLNHASVLINLDDTYILTDPWYDSPAFGSWLSTPPMLFNPVYLISLARSVKNFFIVISHGHDDHCDDEFLKLISDYSTCLIPKYKSPGLKNRVKKCGFKEIIEFDKQGFEIENITFKSYIFKDISMDDALITIHNADHMVVHANDNWQSLPEDVEYSIKKDARDYKESDVLYMCQTNFADGFPLIYTDICDKEKHSLATKRKEKIILEAVKNALNIGSRSFLSYAGHAIPFVKDRKDLRSNNSPVKPYEIQKIKKLLQSHEIEDIVLDMVPGDTYDFKSVNKFFNTDINLNTLFEETLRFYNKKNIWMSCDTFKIKSCSMRIDQKVTMLNTFLDEFKNFVTRKLSQSSYQTDILNMSIKFKDSKISKTCNFTDNPNCKIEITYTDEILEAILKGEINWENSYIGYESVVKTSPSHYNISSLIRWLSMFGYVYQNRIVK